MLRRPLARSLPLCLPLTLAVACGPSTPPGDASDADAASDTMADTRPDGIEGVPETERWSVPGLTAPAHVVRTPGNVPHIYAATREDLARVMGFTVARDRYFMMDMVRRFSQGRLSALFGQDALDSDMENRGSGMNVVVDIVLNNLTLEQQRVFDGFAAGINAYIEAVRANRLPPPSEYAFAVSFLGRNMPVDIMEPFLRRDVAAMMATIVYNLGYETGDVGRANAIARLASPTLFAGAPLEMLRRAGARTDVFERVAPIRPVISAPGFGTAVGPAPTHSSGPMPPPTGPRVAQRPEPIMPESMMARLNEHLENIRRRLGHREGYGSNSWAVMSNGTTDGASLLAGDGHLDLSVPSLFYQIGLDTELLGNGDIHQVGLTIPGMPLLAVGTNGRVAWCQTQLFGDITDWYREEIVLDAAGAPMASRFRGMTRPLMRVDESYTVADVPMLMSRGRTETWARWMTFDGRWITSIEGRSARPGDMLAPGETLVNLQGSYVVPSDTNSDGVISGVSFDYVGLDNGNILQAVERFGRANNVMEFREATRGLVAYSQNIVAADSTGAVLYTSYQTIPCRGYLDRNPDRTWAAGSDPSGLLDGTRYGGFRIPTRDGIVDESMGAADPYACVVPFDQVPQSINPSQAYVVTANNDPGNITIDNSITNDPYYIGGPWMDGYRADRISELLRDLIARRQADIQSMARIQADTRSPIGAQLTPVLLEAIARARTIAAQPMPPPPGSEDARLAALYTANASDFMEVERRLGAWRDGGFVTPAGVDTFYHQLAMGEHDLSIATTIFNAWMGPFVNSVFDDEMFPDGTFSPLGSVARMRALVRMIDGRGPTNTLGLASWNPATGESAFFDVLATPDIETSRQLALQALVRALAFLRSAPTMPGVGGFGSSDMNQWIWGMRHTVRFDSILSGFFSGSGMLGALIERFSITTQRIPLIDMLPPGDPRAVLRGFPRPGDQWGVDAANSGFSGERFTYGAGPAFRMVFALRPDRTTGQNILPGGQSGLSTSRYFADQARLWLGNQSLPVQFAPVDVIAAATGREYFAPVMR